MSRPIFTFPIKYTLAKRLLQLLAITVAVALFPAPATAQGLADLPDIGDPAASVLPLSKERRLGEVFVRGLRASLPLIQDIEINEYVSAVGSQLTNAHPNIQMKFHFLVVRNPTINAFATVGGVITFNSGLLLSAKNESQFVAVLAHEIGHVTQRHIARMLAQYQNFSWTNALAILSIIVATTYDSNLGQLGLFTSTAIPIDQQLAYSRGHEFEADRIGMKLMQNAGIDPIGMSEFFSLLRAQEGNSREVPEFARSHPLTIERISDALNYAKNPTRKYRQNSQEFQFAQARLYALQTPQAALRNTTDSPISAYQRGIALSFLQRPQEAVRVLQQIPNGDNSLPIQLGLAQAEMLQGNNAAATDILQRLNTLYPRRETVSYYLARALLKRGRPSAALAALQPFMIVKQYPLTDKLLAEITAKQGKQGISYEYLSDYYAANGRVRTALKHLEKAASFDSQGHVFVARIETKRKQLEQLKKDLAHPLP